MVPASRRLFLVPGIESTIQTITDEVEADHESDDCKAGPESHPWRLAEELPGYIEHGAPGWRGWQLTKTKKREARFSQNRNCHGERRLHDGRCQYIWQNLSN